MNIAIDHPKQARWLRLILVVTAVFLALGLVSPIITLKKFVLIENTFSVLGGGIAAVLLLALLGLMSTVYLTLWRDEELRG